MNYAGALLQWGEATGDTAARDAGAYLYATQAAAIQDYWFDGAEAIPDGLRPLDGRHDLGRRRRLRHVVQR